MNIHKPTYEGDIGPQPGMRGNTEAAHQGIDSGVESTRLTSVGQLGQLDQAASKGVGTGFPGVSGAIGSSDKYGDGVESKGEVGGAGVKHFHRDGQELTEGYDSTGHRGAGGFTGGEHHGRREGEYETGRVEGGLAGENYGRREGEYQTGNTGTGVTGSGVTGSGVTGEHHGHHHHNHGEGANMEGYGNREGEYGSGNVGSGITGGSRGETLTGSELRSGELRSGNRHEFEGRDNERSDRDY